MPIAVNWIDVAVAVFLLVFAIRGYRRGLSGEILQIVGLLASLLMAYQFFGYVADVLIETISMPEGIAKIIGYLGVFTLFYSIFFVIRVIVHKMMSVSFIAVIEKGGGLMSGMIRGLCILSVIFVLIGMLHQPAVIQYIVKESLSGRYIMPLSLDLYDLLFSATEKAKQFDQKSYMMQIYDEANIKVPVAAPKSSENQPDPKNKTKK